MTAKEFNIIDPTWLHLEEIVKVKCIKNNIEFRDYLGIFLNYILPEYIKSKALIKVVENLNFNDKIKTRAILNKKTSQVKLMN